MSRRILFSLVFTQLTALALLAASASAEAREPSAVTRLQARQDSVSVLEGTLSCRNSETNQGASCKLLFQVNQTGRTLEVAGRKDSAMRLYMDGTRSVAIEGPITGSYLRVERIRALN